MDRISSGLEIVAGIVGERRWWQARAGDLQSWIATLPASATQDHVSQVEWVGNAWDGTSDIVIGEVTVAAVELAQFVAKLRRKLPKLGLSHLRLPDFNDVRQCFASSSSNKALVIDIDLGDFILPLCVKERSLRPEGPGLQRSAARMVHLLAQVEHRRAAILAREIRMRRALEETVARIGAGAAPLWLRMTPLPLAASAHHLTGSPYRMLMVVLNDQLVWAPSGSHRIKTMKDIRDHYGSHFRQQRRRAASAAALHEVGSEGWISDIALALIDEHGLRPGEVFRQAVATGAADRRGGVEFPRNGKRETLHYREGVLIASLEFDGGHYQNGGLRLWGDFPETLALAAKGMPLSALVAHPAFLSTGAIVRKASVGHQVLDLQHDARLMTVEAADARTTASGSGSLPIAA